MEQLLAEQDHSYVPGAPRAHMFPPPEPDVPGACVPGVLCSWGSMFPEADIPRALCSRSPMFPENAVPGVLSSRSPMLSDPDVPGLKLQTLQEKRMTKPGHLYVQTNEWPCGPQTSRGHSEDEQPRLKGTAQHTSPASVQDKHPPPLLLPFGHSTVE